MEEKFHKRIPELHEQMRQGKITRREFLRYATLLGASLVTAKALATPTSVLTGPKVGGTLNYAETGAFNSFNPWRMYIANASLGSQVYSRLLWKDLDGNEHLDMAEGMEMAPDGLSLTVKMHENIKWHDGQECTAQDFVNMFGYTKDPELMEDVGVKKFAGLLKPIEDVQAVDKYSIKFVFAAPVPYGYITDILDYWYAVRIDDKTDAVLQKNLAIGTGPFKMVEWEPNQYTRYVRNEDYYLEGYPYLDEWVFKRLERAETLVPNLLADAVDGIGSVPEPDVEALQKEKDYWVEIATGSGSILNICVNHRLPPFDKKEVRLALSYSLNREAIVKNVFYNLGAPTCSPFWHPASLGYREDLVNAHAFDLDKAAQLLEQAVVKDLEMDIHTPAGWPGWTDYALIWQADLAKIGVTLNVREVEVSKFYDIAADPNLEGSAVHPWATGRTKRDTAIFIFTQPQYVSPNKYGWVNEEFEKLAEDAVVELDPEKRCEMYQRCNEIYMEDLPMLQIMNTVSVRAWHNDVKGPTDDLLGYLVLWKAWLDR
ncbi:MAG: ABC transporter substrate-binding protein [Anaerolineae bacterium]